MMTLILSGLGVGALYATVGILLTIPLVRSGIVNFAIPFYVILGNYLTASLTSAHWAVSLIFVALAGLGFLIGSAQELLTVRPARGDHDTTLVTTIGMGVALEGFILACWGPDPRSVAFFGGNGTLTVFGGRIQALDVCLIGIAAILAIGLHVAVNHTRWGFVGRAAMTDQVAAMLRGINIPRLRTVAFGAAAALAVALGPISGPAMGVALDPALQLVVYSVAAVSIGGVGSFAGTAVGGFALGLVEAFSARYLSVQWATILVFAILCTVLVIKPRGLFGARHLRSV